MRPVLENCGSPNTFAVTKGCGSTVVGLSTHLSFQRSGSKGMILTVRNVHRGPRLRHPFFKRRFSGRSGIGLLRANGVKQVMGLGGCVAKRVVPSFIDISGIAGRLISVHTDDIRVPSRVGNIELGGRRGRTLQRKGKMFLRGVVSGHGGPFSTAIRIGTSGGDLRFVCPGTGRSRRRQRGRRRRGDLIADSNMAVPGDVSKVRLAHRRRRSLIGSGAVFITKLGSGQKIRCSTCVRIGRSGGGLNFCDSGPDFSHSTIGRVAPTDGGHARMTIGSRNGAGRTAGGIGRPLGGNRSGPARGRGAGRSGGRGRRRASGPGRDEKHGE